MAKQKTSPALLPAEVETDLLSDPTYSAQDLKMIKRAIRNDWPISPDLREMLVNRMQEIIKTSDDDRNCIGAARALIQADALNAKREALEQADEHKRMPDKHLHLHAEAQAKVVIHLPDNGR